MSDPAALLSGVASGIASGAIRVVDLTQTLGPDTPVISLPEPLANSPGFRRTNVSSYDEAGPAWYWNAFSLGEHTGTHFDAPIHWITGRENREGGTDTLSVRRCIGSACVVDCSEAAARDPDFLLEPDHLEAWEARYGRILDGAWVLMRTDWSKRKGADFLNDSHVPGPSAAAMAWLSAQRDILGWGVETVGTDAGQAFGFEPAFPAHHYLHGSGRFGLASLANLDQLPPSGAVVIAAPLKLERGSGSPIRALALVPG